MILVGAFVLSAWSPGLVNIVTCGLEVSYFGETKVLIPYLKYVENGGSVPDHVFIRVYTQVVWADTAAVLLAFVPTPSSCSETSRI